MSLSDSQFVTDIVDFLLCTPSAATDMAALGTLLRLRHGSMIPQLGNDRCT